MSWKHQTVLSPVERIEGDVGTAKEFENSMDVVLWRTEDTSMPELVRVSAGDGYERLEAEDGAKDVCGDRLLSSLVRMERPPYDRMGEKSCLDRKSVV